MKFGQKCKKEVIRLSKPKVLIVDDTQIICKALTIVLKEEGFDTDFALDGKQAVQKVKDDGYNVILLDLIMPGMDGIETCRNIKNINSRIECILMTGYTDDQLKDREHSFVQAGGRVYGLYKPFSGDEVITAVNKAIDEQKKE